MSNVIKKVIKNWVEYDIYANGGAAGAGDVTWPASSVDGDIVLFNWTTGKIIKDSWKKLSDYQTALSTQTAYTTKWTATKVPTITTNTLWQVTAITETNITFPVTSVNSNTWAVTVNEVPSWWTDGQVLTKVSGSVAWANASGWIENVTTGTTSTVTGIWAWSEAEYWSITPSGTVLYFTF